ncbi:uncharacterized protein PV09_01626 [Verruconis gallopava]|uniref:BIR-domain-containing protein n=1 Tax=Verruconis gallopava TaxID=253628 RepID=A0A0D1Z3X9_9PEZI|nr:uncharacterized protein PV09_01626 [Verruconis gallopava]KIW07687.1 hypothetical protein PV09_01626 [Verruconis gallopava]
MSIPDGINTFQGRLDTFAQPHHLAKRRASSTKKKGPSAVSWPHSNPLPNDLARAGFFYRPSAESEDNCECFLCHVKLDGWEEGDDPIEEHLKHSPSCGWALNVSIQRKFNNGETVDADPLSEQFVQARTHTFGENWPYESRKGWKPKIAKMVAAGWTYDPSPEYDDGVTCMYCNLSLDGWEPKDDPYAEHQKRCPDCPFFTLVDEWADARKQAKGRKGKARASRGSKASRLSTQSVISIASEAPTQLSLGDLDEPAAEEDSVLTTATNATVGSTTGKGKKKASMRGPKKSTRGKKAAAPVDDLVMETDPPSHIEEASMADNTVKPTRKTTRSKKAAAVEESSKLDTDQSAQIEHPTVIEEQPKRQTRRKGSKSEKPIPIEDTLNASENKRPTRGRPAAVAGKQQARMSEDESQLHSELQAAVDASIMPTQHSGRPARGVKRTSDGALKVETSIAPSEEPVDSETQKARPKRGRKPKPAVAEVQSQDASQPLCSDIIEPEQHVRSMSQVQSKAPKGKKGAKVANTEPEPEMNDQTGEEQNVQLLAEEREEEFDFAESLVNPINPYAPITGTPEYSPGEASPAPSTPTPVRTHQSIASSRPILAPPTSSAERAVSNKATTPISSPNSSDAENRPPSSRPPSTRPPLSVQRQPLASGTPSSNLQLSPSKRVIGGGGLKSILPWSPIDLENIFLNSPVKRNYGLSMEKENTLNMPDVDFEHLTSSKALKEVVERVRRVLGQDERKMTVEQWVRWNASIGEERLRRECESLVMLFEQEGGRALRSLEGIECAP